MHAKDLYTWGKTGINNMSKSELSTYHFPKKTTPLTVYLMPVHCVIPIPSPELVCDHFLLFPSLQCLLIYHILPAWSQKCLWNLAIPFISTAIIQALSLTWTIRAFSQIPVFHPQCQQNYFPVKQIWSCYCPVWALFLALFFSRESRPNSLAWLSLSEISLTSALIVISHPSLSQTLCSKLLNCSLLPQQKCQTLCGFHVFTFSIPLCLVNSFQSQVSLLKCSLLHLMHNYLYAPSLCPLYFAHISVKGTYNTVSIYITTANILCVLTMCHVLC